MYRRSVRAAGSRHRRFIDLRVAVVVLEQGDRRIDGCTGHEHQPNPVVHEARNADFLTAVGGRYALDEDRTLARSLRCRSQS